MSSFSVRVTRTVILAVSVVIFLIVAAAAVFTGKSAGEQARKILLSNSETAREAMEKTLHGVEASADMLATAGTVLEKPGDMARELLFGAARANENITDIELIFKYGHFKQSPIYVPVVRRDNNDELHYTDMAELFKATGKDSFVGTFGKIAESARLGAGWLPPSFTSDSIYIAERFIEFFDRDSSLVGIADISMELSWLTDQMKKIKPYKSSEAILVHPSDEAIYTRSLDMPLMVLKPEGAPETINPELQSLISGQSSGTFNYSGRIWAYSTLSNNWKILLSCTEREVFTDLIKMIVILLLDLIIGLIVISFLSKAILRKELKPIGEFSEAAQSISSGNFNTELPEIRHDDEIKGLHDALDNMQHALSDYVDNLARTTKENERYSSELNIASSIQSSMLNIAFPKDDRFSIYGESHPAKEVGGDLFDCRLIGNKLFFILGDVSGKGVPAALYMSLTMYAARLLADFNLPMAEAASKLNDSFANGNASGMFVTLFMGRLDLETGLLEFVNGGHNPIIVVSPDGKPEYLRDIPVNIACGVFEGFSFKDASMQLQKGTRLLIYTDGITEAFNAAGEEYGEPRLLQAIAAISGKNPDDKTVIREIISDVQAFTGDEPQSDDITLLSVTY